VLEGRSIVCHTSENYGSKIHVKNYGSRFSHRANIGTLRSINPKKPQWIARANRPMVARVRKGWAQMARKIFFMV